MDIEDNNSKKYVLILGGTNFMGKDLALKLSLMKDVEVHCMNRQKLHWNNEWKQIKNLHCHYSDRDVHLEFIKMLAYVSKKVGITQTSGRQWSLVVDFCGYLRKEVKSVIRGLSGLLKLYVFISTDSIYDVCDEAVRNGAIKEVDDLRPSSEVEIKNKAKDEDYGHDKLKCEEYLRSHVGKANSPLPYVCLRLPDVLGPYDSTCRYWAYLMWIQQMNKKPIHSQEESKTAKLSFVYSKDVADLAISMLNKVESGEGEDFVKLVHSQSFNIAFKENPTLDQFITEIAQSLDVENINWRDQKTLKSHGKYFYPSVDCGYLNIKKAKTYLGWEPTPLKECIKETTAFFLEASLYEKEKRIAFKKFEKVNKYYPGV